MRKKSLPVVTKWAAVWIVSVFTMWLIDHGMRVWGLGPRVNVNVDPEAEVLLLEKMTLRDKMFPVLCIVPLWIATSVMWRRVGVEKEERAAVGKQKKVD